MAPKPIYVETFIRAPLKTVWDATQEPARHGAWDLRFSAIDYLPRTAPDEPQRFRYATRIGFGLNVAGQGESVANRVGDAGEHTSVLRFWSDDWKSLIRSGGGYWRYLPEPGGVRFLTLYSYGTRGGWPGVWLDRLVFRPLMGRATAWSFDCLRLSVETGVPARALWTQTAAAVTARATLAAVWVYQGLVPKLLCPDSGELAILRGSGMFAGREPSVLALIGGAEIVGGLTLLWFLHARWPLLVMAAALLALLAGAAVSQPALLVAPFNPPSLSLAMWGMAAAELWLRRDPMPAASRCRRVPPSNAKPLVPESSSPP